MLVLFDQPNEISGIKIMKGYNYDMGDGVGDRFTQNSRVKRLSCVFQMEPRKKSI